jgi:hypothetical protein
MENEKIEFSEALNEIAAALSKAQGLLHAAAKDSENPHFKSKYADLSSIWDSCREALSSNGLSVVQMPVTESNQVGMVTTLLHSSGQWMRNVVYTVPRDMSPQSVGSAVTYLRRYSLAAVVGVVADVDDDGNAAQPTAGQPSSVPAQRAATAPQQSASAPKAAAQAQLHPLSTKPCNKCHRPILWMKDDKGKNACFDPESFDARSFAEDQFWLSGEGAKWTKGPRQSGQGFIRHPMDCDKQKATAPQATAPQQEDGPPPYDDDDLPF